MTAIFFIFLLPFLNLISGQSVEEARSPENGLALVCKPLDKTLDLLFILDGSGSVSGGTWNTQIDLVKKILDQIEIGPEKTRVAVIQYSGWTRLEFDFKEHKNRNDLKENLDKIRFLTGTTKTGRALEKAIETLTIEKGSRVDRQDVARVVVLVSDGYSSDDPVPFAKKLRDDGVQILTLGIGDYVNEQGMLEIAGAPERMFRNTSVAEFVEAFRKIAIGEVCNYAKGPRGAEITCGEEGISVDVLTKFPFKGHLYVQGHLGDPDCTVSADGQTKELSLKIPLMKCGVQQQFLFNPRGMLFESQVMLKFHEQLSTKIDKSFTIRCFYADHPKPTESTSLVRNKTSIADGENNLVEKPHHTLAMQLPCAYTLRSKAPDGCVVKNADVGELVFHRWECDKRLISPAYSMLVHSCFILGVNNQQMMLLDQNGCPIDRKLMNIPSYEESLLAVLPSSLSKFADQGYLQYRCSLRFCNRNKGECDGIVPPRCDPRQKRQAAVIRMQQMVDMIHKQAQPLQPNVQIPDWIKFQPIRATAFLPSNNSTSTPTQAIFVRTTQPGPVVSLPGLSPSTRRQFFNPVEFPIRGGQQNVPLATRFRIQTPSTTPKPQTTPVPPTTSFSSDNLIPVENSKTTANFDVEGSGEEIDLTEGEPAFNESLVFHPMGLNPQLLDLMNVENVEIQSTPVMVAEIDDPAAYNLEPKVKYCEDLDRDGLFNNK